MADAEQPSRPAPATGSRIGLRGRLSLLFGIGALLLSLLFAVGAYLTTRHLLINQREQIAISHAHASASFLSNAAAANSDLNQALEAISRTTGGEQFLRVQRRWHGPSPDDTRPLPSALQETVESGQVAFAWTDRGGHLAIAVGVPVAAVSGAYYEVTPVPEFSRTLGTIAGVLASITPLTTALGVVVGRYTAKRALEPLREMAVAGARLGSGDLATRLPATRDPELATIVGSFNAMADTIERRIDRDARFAADVSHELRSPMTTLVAGVARLQRGKETLPPQAQTVVELLAVEVGRFERTLDDLMELGAFDGSQPLNLDAVDAAEVARHTLSRTGRSPDLLDVAPGQHPLRADKGKLSRALLNLLENADKYAGGPVGVRVWSSPDRVFLAVDDAGPGVAAEEREHVFDRFVRGGARGSRSGTGLGLSIVDETARAHGGRVGVLDRDPHGASFVIALPRRDDDDETGPETDTSGLRPYRETDTTGTRPDPVSDTTGTRTDRTDLETNADPDAGGDPAGAAA